MAADRDIRHEVEQWWDSLDLDDLSPPSPPTTAAAQQFWDHGGAGSRDWADELEERLLEAPTAAAPVRARPVPGRRVVLGVAGAVGLVVAVAVAVFGGAPEETQTGVVEVSLVSATPAPPAVAPSAAAHCPTRIEGATVSGAGRGGTGSAPEAILGFEHAYYIERSGTAARAFTTPDAAVPAAGVIQAGIDSVPQGTTHCVRVTPAGPDTWAVDLSEYRPGEREQRYLQTVTTTSRNGTVLITRIGQR
ncbi:hypothetical protein [Nocardia sp. NPDC003963]